MANSALSNLDTGAALSAGNLIYVVQGGNSRKRALTAIGASLLNDTGTTGVLTSIGIPALGRSLLDDTGQTTMQTTLGLGSAASQDTGRFLSGDSKGDTGDVILWTATGGAGEGPKLPGGAGVGGILVDTGTAQSLSGKTISGSSIADTGVQLAAYFAAGVGADTGTFLRGDGSWAAPVGGNEWTYATPQATTSGTAFDFTGIPTGVSEIEITLEGVSLSGTDNFLIQIGDAGGIETSGYDAGSFNNAADANSTAGFLLLGGGAGAALSGAVRLIKFDSTGVSWSSIHGVKSTASFAGGGTKTLSAELTQVRLTRTGTNTFDAGQVSLRYR